MAASTTEVVSEVVTIGTLYFFASSSMTGRGSRSRAMTIAGGFWLMMGSSCLRCLESLSPSKNDISVLPKAIR